MACLKLPMSYYALPSKASGIQAVRKQQKHAFMTVHAGPESAASTKDVSSSSSSKEETVGHGFLAKSRGEAFLEKALSMRQSSPRRRNESSSDELNKRQLSRREKEKKKKMKKAPVKSFEPACYGCGAVLQTKDAEAPGFVPLDTYLTKKKHHQLRTVLCGRCRLLAHGQMIPAVGGHGGYAGGKRFVSAEQLRSQLSHLSNEKALIIKLVDIVDFNGSFLARIRDLVGANPIVLVATKIDLLPRETDLNAVGDWIVEYLIRKKVNVISVHLTSSKSLWGISGIVSFLRQHRQGRDVYILGSANVGKSAFVSAVLQEMAQRDPAATAAMRHMPVQSAMPGTTLGPIEIKAFSGGGSMFDMPGIHVHHRMTAIISPDDLSLLAPRRRLRGFFLSPSVSGKTSRLWPRNDIGPDSNLESDEQSDQESYFEDENVLQGSSSTVGKQNCLAGMSVLWGGIVRLDIVKAPPNVGLRFYGPNAVTIYSVPTNEAGQFYKEELGKKLIPPRNTHDWEGLQSQHSFNWTLKSWDRPLCDIAFSGVGWISIEPAYSYAAEYIEADLQNSENEVQVIVHVPKALEIFVRTPLPVGVHGPEWYDYRDLSDEELEARPRVFLS